jgi:hypothetical protein
LPLCHLVPATPLLAFTLNVNFYQRLELSVGLKAVQRTCDLYLATWCCSVLLLEKPRGSAMTCRWGSSLASKSRWMLLLCQFRSESSRACHLQAVLNRIAVAIVRSSCEDIVDCRLEYRLRGVRKRFASSRMLLAPCSSSYAAVHHFYAGAWDPNHTVAVTCYTRVGANTVLDRSCKYVIVPPSSRFPGIQRSPI